MGEQECGRARESEREDWEGVGERESVGEGERLQEREWGEPERERESVGEQERMWERTENVGTDLDLSLIVFLVCLFV